MQSTIGAVERQISEGTDLDQSLVDAVNAAKIDLQTCSGKPGCFSPWMDSCFSKKFVICIFNCVDTFINRCEVNT